jgi:hypothetical protein
MRTEPNAQILRVSAYIELWTEDACVKILVCKSKTDFKLVGQFL